MKPSVAALVQQVDAEIRKYEAEIGLLPGIANQDRRDTLYWQLAESLRRIEYISAIQNRPIADERRNPNSALFDPLKCAILEWRTGHIDEAFWLVFLATHAGKHPQDGWRVARDIYGSFGLGQPWTWERLRQDATQFRGWMHENWGAIQADGISRRFGNHRKYETLDPHSDNGTWKVIESYVAWVMHYGSHQQMIRDIQAEFGQNPEVVFKTLYSSMKAVTRFGRLGKFDYLTMLDKLGFAPIRADSAYLSDATGPKKGAKLLFFDNPDAIANNAELDSVLIDLGHRTGLGLQALEDALCNWQKSPAVFVAFR